VKVLVATTAGAGHFGPLVPFAAACRDSGHEVRVAAPASFASTVQRAGFDHVPVADGPQHELRAVFEGLSRLSREDGDAAVVRDIFARIDARAALAGMEAVASQWQPHVIVREMYEFASYVVAEARGIPHVQVATGLASAEEFAFPLVDEPLRELGSKSGTAGLRAAPRLSMVPALLEDRVLDGVGPTHRFRSQTSAEGPADELPDWWSGAREPLVYVTFGSVAGGMGFFPDFYQGVIMAIAELPVRVLLTIGDVGDPEMLAPVPENVHVERWWPQQQVMPHAAAVVAHGGFGTIMLALSSGLPMVLVPLFALDQYYNAGRVQVLGAAIALENGPGAVSQVRGALQRVLNEDSYRAAAAAVAKEIAQLPDASQSIAVLERLIV